MRTSKRRTNAGAVSLRARASGQAHACGIHDRWRPQPFLLPFTIFGAWPGLPIDRNIWCNGTLSRSLAPWTIGLAAVCCREGLREASKRPTAATLPATGAMAPCKLNVGPSLPRREPTSLLRASVRLPVSCLHACAGDVGARIRGGMVAFFACLTYRIPLSRRVVNLLFSNIGL